MKLKYFFCGFLVLVFSLFYIMYVRASFEQRKKDEEAAKWREYQAFEEGFWAGRKATVNALTLNTNTGKWTLELTNLLDALNKAHVVKP